MKIFRTLLPGICFTAALSCSNLVNPEAVSEPDVAPVAEISDASFLPGVLNVEFSEEMTAMIEAGMADGGQMPTKSAYLMGTFQEMGITSIKRVFPDAGKWEPRHRAAGLHRWYKVQYNPEVATRTKAVQSMEGLQGVLNAAAQPVIKPAAYFNDPYADDQWHYRSPGPKAGDYVWGADINVEPVWANYTAGSKDVIVGVVDTGIDLKHADLAPVIIPPGPEGSKCFCYDYEGYDITSDNHSTHVSGTIAAINNNGKGLCGIAGGNDGTGGVRILECQIFRTVNEKTIQGNGEHAIVWAADHGAVICNNSWGTTFESEVDARAAKEKDFELTRRAVEYFNKNAGTDINGNQVGPMKGGVVFFSAGNDGWRAGWPAKLDCVIAVGASNSMNLRTSYSNYGDWVDICCPGGDGKEKYNVHSCYPGNKYGGMTGTSMACPHASGVAALIVSYFGGPGFTADMLKEKLLKGASHKKMSPAQQIGPLIDAYGSFSLGSEIAPDPVSDLELTSTTNNAIFSWKVPADADDKVAAYYLLALSKDKSAVEGMKPGTVSEGVRVDTTSTGGAKLGDILTWEMEELEFETEYYGVMFAYDACGNYAPASPVRKVRTQKNNPPVFDITSPEKITLKAHEVKRYDFYGHDPDGHKFTMTLTPGSAAVKASTFLVDHMQITLTGKLAPAGTYNGKVTATDNYGCSSDFNFQYTILENHAPVLKKSFDNILFAKPGESVTLDLNGFAEDPDEEKLIYRATSENERTAMVKIEGESVKITSAGYGATEVVIKASDNLGASCETRVKVLVRDGSRTFDLFPNPVTEGKLYVRPGKDTTADIQVSSKSGAEVLNIAGLKLTPFEPAVLDFAGIPAGVYYVNVKSEGKDATYSIVKL